MSTRTDNSTETKAMETLLHLATHDGSSRILSHIKDLTFQLAIAKSSDQSKATQRGAVEKAANQLKSIERESRGGDDGLARYVKDQKEPVQAQAKAFLKENQALSQQLRDLLDRSDKNQAMDFSVMDVILDSLQGDE